MGSNVLINRLGGAHLFLDRQTCQQASLVPVSKHLAQVLIGREEAYHPSRDHAAQVTEDATRLLHLQKPKSWLGTGTMATPKQLPFCSVECTTYSLTRPCPTGDSGDCVLL